MHFLENVYCTVDYAFLMQWHSNTYKHGLNGNAYGQHIFQFLVFQFLFLTYLRQTVQRLR